MSRRRTRRLEVAAELTRYLGAVSLLLVSAIHAQQYYDDYFSVVPTIGTLFLLNFVGAGAVGLVLLAPVKLLGRRVGEAMLALAALAAIAIAIGSMTALLISEYRPLFGFMESGYRLAIVLALAFEGLTTVFLASFLVTLALGRREADVSPAARAGRRPRGADDGSPAVAAARGPLAGGRPR